MASQVAVLVYSISYSEKLEFLKTANILLKLPEDLLRQMCDKYMISRLNSRNDTGVSPTVYLFIQFSAM